MTHFEMLANEMNVPVEIYNNGFYKGITKALATIVNEVILSEDETIFEAGWEKQKEMIKRKFYNKYPYMA